MLITTLMIVGYAMIGLMENTPIFCFVCYCISVLLQIGLLEIATAMSDPFGEDDLDFDLDGLLNLPYRNTVAFLRDQHQLCGRRVPQEVPNLITTATVTNDIFYAANVESAGLEVPADSSPEFLLHPAIRSDAEILM